MDKVPFFRPFGAWPGTPTRTQGSRPGLGSCALRGCSEYSTSIGEQFLTELFRYAKAGCKNRAERCLRQLGAAEAYRLKRPTRYRITDSKMLSRIEVANGK